MHNKHIITRNFSNSSISYDKVDSIQKNIANILVGHSIKFLGAKYPKNILDIGCGTGNVTEALYNYYPNANYTINDISKEMVQATKNKLSNFIEPISIVGDIETQNLLESYNLIISNMCLQWTNDLFFTIDKLSRKTEFMAFSVPLLGTFRDWYNLFYEEDKESIEKMYYTSNQITENILNLGKKLIFSKTANYSIDFSNAIDAAKYIKALGVNNIVNNNNFVHNFKIFRKYKNRCHLNYIIGYFILQDEQ